ncbi:MAG TPA: hypothetical protein VFH56_01395 [Acidimicrobiales bacterium]|nr:hypothetical protein [Acidimicrobiales bacterium]
MRGQVPTARVAPIIALLIRERWPQGGGYEVLAEKVGCDWSAVRGIAEARSDGAEFNLVDQILCSLGRPDFWWGELADIYYGCDLRGNPKGYLPAGYVRCERVGCGNVFKPHKRAPKTGPHKPKFCSPRCNDSTYRARKRGGFKRGAYGPDMRLRAMVCHQGHDMTPENTLVRKNGKRCCIACNRERQKKWIAAKRAKQRELARAA